MSPPAATFENPIAVHDISVPVKKNLAVKPAANGQTKTLAEMENKWESFTFSPIRESQVSRAMSTARPFLLL
jgi:thiamine thiazole synthase